MRDNFQNGHGSVEDIVTVPLNRLLYRKDYIAYQRGQSVYVCPEIGLSPLLAGNKNHPNIKNKSTELLLNYSSNTFRFLKSSVLKMLRQLSNQLEKDFIERRNNPDSYKDDYIIKSLAPKKVKANISFSSLRFGDGYISFRYKGTYYQYRNSSFKGFDIIVKQYLSRCSDSRRKRFNSNSVVVIMDEVSKSFVFSGFNIYQYIMNIKDSFLPEKKKVEVRKEILPKVETVPQKTSSSLKTMTLGFENIEFFDGYFLVWILQNGQKDTSIYPLRKDSSHSFSRLRYVHKHLSNRFPTDIRAKYDDKRVLSLSKEYDLRDYIRVLDDHKDDKYSEWWIEEMNSKKESLESCRSKTNVKKEIALKNEYFDILSALQNGQKLIPAYEIDHGNKEDAFIFTIDMPKNRSAIIFENIKPAKTTEFFVVKPENYESCLHRIFEHFTNYNFLTKRYSIRFGKNIADSFDAESYCYIDHKGIEQWVNCLMEKLEKNSPQTNIEFVPGLRTPNNPTIRSGHDAPIRLKNLHNELVIKLFAKLSEKYGKQNVGTEIRVGDRRIDTVVKKDNCFDIYEVKSASTPLDCVLEASGQLLLYAYWNCSCSDKIGKMVIVGQSPVTEDVEDYLSTLREKHSLPLYYMKI